MRAFLTHLARKRGVLVRCWGKSGPHEKDPNNGVFGKGREDLFNSTLGETTFVAENSRTAPRCAVISHGVSTAA